MKQFLKNHLNIFIGLLIGATIGLFMVGAHYLKLFDQYELKTLDARFKLLQAYRHPPSEDIIIIGVDDVSVAKIGRWPWKRSEHAKIVDFLKLYNAKVIFFDMFFTYRDKDHSQADAEFVKSVKKAGNVYLPGKFIPITQDLEDDFQIKQKDKLMKKFALTDTKDIPALDASHIVPKGKEIAYELPFYELTNASRNIGSVHTGKNDDGASRYQDLIYKYKGDYYPALSLKVAMDLKNIKGLRNWQNKGYMLGDSVIPLDENNNFIVNWHGRYDKANKRFTTPYEQWGVWRIIESYDLMKKASAATGLSMPEFKQLLDKVEYYQNNNKEIPDDLWQCVQKIPPDFELKFNGWNPSEIFRDKIVLIGVASTSTTVRDIISNPIYEEIPGVYLHANVMDNVLNNDFLSKVNRGYINLIILIVGILSGLSIYGVRNSLVSLTYPILLAIAYLIIAVVYFMKYNVWLDIVYVETTIAITFALSSAVYYVIEGKEKLKIKYALSNYLSPQIMNEVLSDPAKLNLGGSKRELTILFSDIRGFTSLSESLDPQEVVMLLNEYFSAMVEIIFNNKGTFDKFIGDAIMAFWNAPVEVEDHPYLAVKTAVEMMEELAKLREKWATYNKRDINIGIGINTAEVTVGNIGSAKIKDYTIIGDGVNLASRLESLNKEYSTNIIISEYTYEKIKDKVNVRYLDMTKVKGKDKPVKVFEVLGLKTKGEKECQIQELLQQH